MLLWFELEETEKEIWLRNIEYSYIVNDSVSEFVKSCFNIKKLTVISIMYSIVYPVVKAIKRRNKRKVEKGLGENTSSMHCKMSCI